MGIVYHPVLLLEVDASSPEYIHQGPLLLVVTVRRSAEDIMFLFRELFRELLSHDIPISTF